MTEPDLPLVDLSHEVLEHALRHAEQPWRDCHICANGTPIRPEDYDLAISARVYNGRKMLGAMIKHLGRQRYPQVSLMAIYQLVNEVGMLQAAKAGMIVPITKEM
jgi:hypothetical protein